MSFNLNKIKTYYSDVSSLFFYINRACANEFSEHSKIFSCKRKKNLETKNERHKYNTIISCCIDIIHFYYSYKVRILYHELKCVFLLLLLFQVHIIFNYFIFIRGFRENTTEIIPLFAICSFYKSILPFTQSAVNVESKPVNFFSIGY